MYTRLVERVPPNSNDNLLKNVEWALRFVWESGRRLTIVNVALTFLQSIIPLLSLYMSKLVIDTVAAGIVPGADRTAALRHLTFLVGISAVIILIDRVLTTLVDWVRSAQSYVATDRVYELLHSKSIEVDLNYYENADFYDALHRAQAEAPFRPTRILDAVFSIAQSGVSVIALAGLLLTFHWSVPLVLVVASIPDLLIRFRFARQLYVWHRRQTPAERQALYFTSLLTGDTHAKEIRLFDLGHIFEQRFGVLRRQIRREKLDLLRRRSIADLLAQAGAITPVFALYGFLAYRAIQGQMTVGDLVMFYQAVQRGQGYVAQFLGNIAVLYENNLFLSNVHEFLALKPRVVDPPHPKSPVSTNRQGIVFENVSFRYPNSDRLILDHVSFSIGRGQHVALVGENGCGKTTLVKLLLRLYDPSGGVITFDGVDLREMSLRGLRRRISVVFQDYAKYHLSALENIWFGDVDGPPEERRIAEAARKSGADKTISALPNGYSTLLGKWFADGEELSTGEWQKIALARAFLREAEVIVMDEPTSALDAKAEYEVFNKFHQLSSGRSAVLISHRLSTVKMVDQIYFLENGVIIESGSHDALIERGGKYAYMFERQAQYYR